MKKVLLVLIILLAPSIASAYEDHSEYGSANWGATQPDGSVLYTSDLGISPDEALCGIKRVIGTFLWEDSEAFIDIGPSGNYRMVLRQSASASPVTSTPPQMWTTCVDLNNWLEFSLGVYSLSVVSATLEDEWDDGTSGDPLCETRQFTSTSDIDPYRQWLSIWAGFRGDASYGGRWGVGGNNGALYIEQTGWEQDGDPEPPGVPPTLENTINWCHPQQFTGVGAQLLANSQVPLAASVSVPLNGEDRAYAFQTLVTNDLDFEWTSRHHREIHDGEVLDDTSDWWCFVSAWDHWIPAGSAGASEPIDFGLDDSGSTYESIVLKGTTSYIPWFDGSPETDPHLWWQRMGHGSVGVICLPMTDEVGCYDENTQHGFCNTSPYWPEE